MALLS